MNIIEKKAFFNDYRGNEQYARVRIADSLFIEINTYDTNNNHTGYMNIYFHPNKRLYLDTIYCYDQFRGAGIARMISELADYILKDYFDYVIRGVYEPGQLSTDRKIIIDSDKEKLDFAARKFYKKTGYQIIELENFLYHKDDYEYIMEEDFNLGEDKTPIIVAKKNCLRYYEFYEENGTIYHINYFKPYSKIYK